MKTFKSIWKCIWLEQFFKPVYVSCRQYGEGQKGWGPWVCGTVMINRRGSNIPLPLRLQLTNPSHIFPSWPTLLPPNLTPNPAQLTWTPCPSDLNTLPIWPGTPAHLTPPIFHHYPPYPTPPLPSPKMVSETNLEGLKNCFNQIHFQINFMSSSMTLKVIFDEVCTIRLCIYHCSGNKGSNYMLLMDDGRWPSQGFSLPQVIIWLGLTLFSTQKGCIQQLQNHVDTPLVMVTRSVYNHPGSNQHLT